MAVDKCAAGSWYRTMAGLCGMVSPIEVLTGVVDAVGGRVPVLIDAVFDAAAMFEGVGARRRAVLVARPAMWGLAAYGSDGVQESSSCCKASSPA
jgi:isopentenyl diphosphate isomerase/L-lactate dehydrogenase-like FMN-dependent dehydrogenase